MRKKRVIAGLLSVAMAIPMMNVLLAGKRINAYSRGDNTVTSLSQNTLRSYDPTGATNSPTPVTLDDTTTPTPLPEGWVEINETNFPDEVFRDCVEKACDKNTDYLLSPNEISSCTYLYAGSWSSKKIQSCQGIEFLTNLSGFDCTNNQLTTLDLSSVSQLRTLNCSNNQLTELDLSQVPNLSTLDCSNNQLTELDLSYVPNISTLSCSNNPLTTLNVNTLTQLTYLYCTANQLTALDVSDLTKLYSLDCSNNQLTTLDVSDLTNLDTLKCSNNQLTTLDVSSLSYLHTLFCAKNAINDLIFGTTSHLREINCSNNQLSQLDISNIPFLQVLNCSDNKLTELNANEPTNLTSLICNNNLLTSLDVSKNVTLHILECYGNNLSSFDLSIHSILIHMADDDHPNFSSEYVCHEAGTLIIGENEYSNVCLKYDFDTEIIPNEFSVTPTPTPSPVPPTPTPSSDFEINEIFFPDENFRIYVKRTCDHDGDNILSKSELDTVRCINVYGNVESLQGIQFFTNLEELMCENNKLTEIDVSELPNIKNLMCRNNLLTEIHLGQQTQLRYLDCQNNSISEIDISGCPLLCRLVNESTNYGNSLYTEYSNNLFIEELNTSIPLRLACDASTNIITSHLTPTPTDTPTPEPPPDTPTPVPTTDTPTPTPLPEGWVEINETNFPDENFRFMISKTADKDRDGVLSSAEISSTTDLFLGIASSVYNKPISSLEGIEYFTSLTYLDCSNNQITSLDVSQLTKLITFNCSNNPLTSLNLGQLTSLIAITCENTSLEGLNLSQLSNLSRLECSGSQLKTLDVSQNTNLVSLDCSENQLSSLNLGSLQRLNSITCSGNQLTMLDVSKIPGLRSLNCENNLLVGLDFGSIADLHDLNCANNQLTSLDISNGLYITQIDCSHNQLTFFDVSGLRNLITLDCSNNAISVLNVVGPNAIRTLICDHNDLDVLDISKNVSLETLVCYANGFSSFDLSVHSKLIKVVKPEFLKDSSEYTWYEGSIAIEEEPMYNINLCLKCDKDTEIVPNEFSVTPTPSPSPAPTVDTPTPIPTPIEYVEINEENFPDEGFRTFAQWNNQDNDNVLSRFELDQVTSIGSFPTVVYSLKGIEYFTNTEVLTCNGSKVTELDVSSLSKLKRLSCEYVPLSDLKLGNLENLQMLICTDTFLKTIDISDCPLLVRLVKETSCTVNGPHKIYSGSLFVEELNDTVDVRLVCDLDTQLITEKVQNTPTPLPGTFVEINEDNFPDENFRNELKSNVDVNKNNVLSSFEISNVIALTCREYTSLEGLEYFTNLKSLTCTGCNADYLNLDVFEKLEHVIGDYCTVTSIDVGTNPNLLSFEWTRGSLKNLYISDCTNLSYINCSGNQLERLSFSELPNLTTLNCSDNQLSDIELDEVSGITSLNCSKNQFKDLNWNHLTGVTNLDCSNNQLFELELDKVPGITVLNCSDNQLSELDVLGLAGLQKLQCYGNSISELEISLDSEISSVLKPAYKKDSNQFNWYEGEPASTDLLFKSDADTSVIFYDPSFGATPTPIHVNSGAFMDPRFESYLFQEFDTDQDWNLSWNELKEVKTLQLNDVPIDSLQGIEYLANLEVLEKTDGGLTELDVSKNTELKSLKCQSNSLTSLTLGNNAKLEYLDCSGNSIVSLDLSKCTSLKQLYCYDNELASLNVSGCPDLYVLKAHFNNFIDLDISSNSSLSALRDRTKWNREIHQYNMFSDTNASGDECALTYDLIVWPSGSDVGYSYRHYSVPVPIDEYNFPDSEFRNYVRYFLDLNKDNALTWNELARVGSIDVSESSIESLEGISYFVVLDRLDCSNAQLQKLDLSFNVFLRYLDCSGNKLTSLTLGDGSSSGVACLYPLETLNCSDNLLTSLDLRQCYSLRGLQCHYNALTSLDISSCEYLNYMYYNFFGHAYDREEYYRTHESEYYCSAYDGTNTLSFDFLVNLKTESEEIPAMFSFTPVAINETTFPDDNFRDKVTSEYDLNHDGILSWKEVVQVARMRVEYMEEVTSLKGIEYFLALRELRCQEDRISTLDVSKNTWLGALRCFGNNMTSLSICGGEQWTMILCHYNNLTNLDISDCPNLPFSEQYRYDNNEDYAFYGYSDEENVDHVFTCDFNLKVKVDDEVIVVHPLITPTETETPTPTQTETPTPTETETPTPTQTSTPTRTKKATPTPTKKTTPTPTKKATPTPTKKATPTPTKKATPKPTKKATATPTVKVSAPSNVKAVASSPSTVDISWTPAPNTDFVQVWRTHKANAQQSDYVLLGTYYASDGKSVSKSLTPGKTYYYKLRSYKKLSNGSKVYSGYSTIVSAAPKVDNPTGLKVTATTSNSISLSWDKVNGTNIFYEVWRLSSPENTPGALLGIYTDTTKTSTNLASGTTYYYRVRAYYYYKDANDQEHRVYSGYSSIVSAKTK